MLVYLYYGKVSPYAYLWHKGMHKNVKKQGEKTPILGDFTLINK